MQFFYIQHLPTKPLSRILCRMGSMMRWWFVMLTMMGLSLPVTVTAQTIPFGPLVIGTTQSHSTSAANKMALLDERTDKTSGSSALDIFNDQPYGTHTYRLGILPSVTDEQTTAIIKMFEDAHHVFELIKMSGKTWGTFSSYDSAFQEIRSQNLTAIIGSFHPEYSVACEHLRLPYLVTSHVPHYVNSSSWLIELFPDRQVFAKATLDMMQYYHIRKVAVFYDSRSGAAILEMLLGQTQLMVTAFHVQHLNISQIRLALKQLRDQYFTSFVVVLEADATAVLMDQALSLSMFSSPFKWILVNMGLEEFSLEQYVDSRANITVLRLMMDYTSQSCALQPEMITLKRAIFHDAVKVFILFVNEHFNEELSEGESSTQIHGCTGNLNFSSGGRSEYFLQIMTLQGYRTGEVTEEEFVRILDPRKKWRKEKKEKGERQLWGQRLSGTWRSNENSLYKRLIPSRSYSLVARMNQNVFGPGPLRVTTKEEMPFIQYRENNSTFRERGISMPDGRELEGMCVDILKELSSLLGFTFNVTMVPDGKFGSLKPHGWTGMVRQLKDDNADLAMAPFQMSELRSTVVDFTKPFMTKGTTVVVRRPEQRVWIFQFLSPLSKAVWSAIFLAFIIVSVTLFGVSRVNSDRRAKYTGNLRESFWYIWGTLLRGSLNGSPHAISSRIVSSAWWFFCLIVSSIYTANLAAFLTITIGDAGFNSAADLAHQSKYDYGTVDGSQTQTFFNHTSMPEYAKMWAHMSISPGSIVRRVNDGFERVRAGGYAFIWDSPTIRYEIANDCNLIEVGSHFDSKGYAFAIQKNAPYAEKLSWALLKLNDDGILYRLERKWFRPQHCPSHLQSAITDSLRPHQVSGIYLVLLAGIVLSVTLCIIQYYISRWRAKNKKTNEEDSDGTRIREPCLKSRSNMDSSNVNSETTQVYANHSPYGFQSATYSQSQW